MPSDRSWETVEMLPVRMLSRTELLQRMHDLANKPESFVAQDVGIPYLHEDDWLLRQQVPSEGNRQAKLDWERWASYIPHACRPGPYDHLDPPEVPTMGRVEAFPTSGALSIPELPLPSGLHAWR